MTAQPELLPLHGDDPRRGAQPVPRVFSRALRHRHQLPISRLALAEIFRYPGASRNVTATRRGQKTPHDGGLMPCSSDSSTDSAHTALRNGSTNAPCGSSTSRKRTGDSSTGKPGTSITARAVDWLLVGVFVFALWAAAVVWLTVAV